MATDVKTSNGTARMAVLLPAYMVWHLEHHDQQTDSNTVDYLVWNLTWDDDKDEHIVEGFRGWSPQQTSAVDAFVRFIAAQSHDYRLAAGAATARQSYWAGAAG